MRTQLAKSTWKRGLCWIIAIITASIVTSSYASPSSVISIRTDHYPESGLMNLPVLSGTDAEVKEYVRRYLTLGRLETEYSLGRAQYFFPIIEPYLREAHLPNALKYLPMVESTLIPEVVSPAGAAGLWQIMPATGRYFGLEITESLDERRDPHRSTQAAVSLLLMLQTEFCDWYLVLAAYNCGPGRVRRAIRQAGSRDYEAIRQFLPKQTRNYISKFIAVTYVANSYDQHGLEPRLKELYAQPTQQLHIDEALDLAELAERSGVALQTIRELNPGLLKTMVPSRKEGWNICLPQEAVSRYFGDKVAKEAAEQTLLLTLESREIGPETSAPNLSGVNGLVLGAFSEIKTPVYAPATPPLDQSGSLALFSKYFFVRRLFGIFV